MEQKKAYKTLEALEAWREGEPKSLIITMTLMIKLFLDKECSVQEMVDYFSTTQPNVVRHMNALSAKGLVEHREVLQNGVWKKLWSLTTKGQEKVNGFVTAI